jgi:hypothetical protein
METPYLFVEAPSKDATIDFAGKFGCTVKLELTGNELWVQIIGDDDRNTILEDKVYTIPEADRRH